MSGSTLVKVPGIKGRRGGVRDMRDTRDTRGGYRCNESLFTATAIHCRTRHTRDITTMGTLMSGTLDLDEPLNTYKQPINAGSRRIEAGGGGSRGERDTRVVPDITHRATALRTVHNRIQVTSNTQHRTFAKFPINRVFAVADEEEGEEEGEKEGRKKEVCQHMAHGTQRHSTYRQHRHTHHTVLGLPSSSPLEAC